MNRARTFSAFTLIELVLAVAITVVIAAVLLSVTAATLRIWKKSQDSFGTDTSAALILDFLERDLEGAIFRNDGNLWLRCETFDDLTAHGWRLPTNAPMKPAVSRFLIAGSASTIADSRFSRSGHWLRFFTTTGGEPVGVGYQIVRRSFSGASTPDPETVRYSLFRRVITQEDTFSKGYQITAHADLVSPEATYNAGTNVIDFGVWFYRAGTIGALEPIQDPVVEIRNAPALVVADVMVRILTEEGATLISAMERGLVAIPAEFGGDTDAWWWSVAEQNSRVYVRRIPLRTVAL